MDSTTYFKFIIKNIKEINNDYNQKYDFKPITRIKKKSQQSDYNLTMETNLLKNRCTKMNKIKKIKNNSTSIKSEIETNINIFDCDINTSNEKSTNKKWKDLDIELQLINLNNYLELNPHIKINDTLKEELIQLVKDGKLNYKKYLDYDIVNERIENLPVIRYDNEAYEYKLLTTIEKNRKHSHKKKLSKIIKI